MRVGVYFCRCGGIISDRIDAEEVRRALEATGAIAYFRTVDLACGEDGIAEITSDLRANRPDAVVVAACSPRDHEDTFRRVLAGAGLDALLRTLLRRSTPRLAFLLSRAAIVALARAPLTRMPVVPPVMPLPVPIVVRPLRWTCGPTRQLGPRTTSSSMIA